MGQEVYDDKQVRQNLIRHTILLMLGSVHHTGHRVHPQNFGKGTYVKRWSCPRKRCCCLIGPTVNRMTTDFEGLQTTLTRINTETDR